MKKKSDEVDSYESVLKEALSASRGDEPVSVRALEPYKLPTSDPEAITAVLGNGNVRVLIPVPIPTLIPTEEEMYERDFVVNMASGKPDPFDMSNNLVEPSEFWEQIATRAEIYAFAATRTLPVCTLSGMKTALPTVEALNVYLSGVSSSITMLEENPQGDSLDIVAIKTGNISTAIQVATDDRLYSGNTLLAMERLDRMSKVHFEGDISEGWVAAKFPVLASITRSGTMFELMNLIDNYLPVPTLLEVMQHEKSMIGKDTESDYVVYRFSPSGGKMKVKNQQTLSDSTNFVKETKPYHMLTNRPLWGRPSNFIMNRDVVFKKFKTDGGNIHVEDEDQDVKDFGGNHDDAADPIKGFLAAHMSGDEDDESDSDSISEFDANEAKASLVEYVESQFSTSPFKTTNSAAGFPFPANVQKDECVYTSIQIADHIYAICSKIVKQIKAQLGIDSLNMLGGRGIASGKKKKSTKMLEDLQEVLLACTSKIFMKWEVNDTALGKARCINNFSPPLNILLQCISSFITSGVKDNYQSNRESNNLLGTNSQAIIDDMCEDFIKYAKKYDAYHESMFSREDLLFDKYQHGDDLEGWKIVGEPMIKVYSDNVYVCAVYEKDGKRKLFYYSWDLKYGEANATPEHVQLFFMYLQLKLQDGEGNLLYDDTWTFLMQCVLPYMICEGRSAVGSYQVLFPGQASGNQLTPFINQICSIVFIGAWKKKKCPLPLSIEWRNVIKDSGINMKVEKIVEDLGSKLGYIKRVSDDLENCAFMYGKADEATGFHTKITPQLISDACKVEPLVIPMDWLGNDVIYHGQFVAALNLERVMKSSFCKPKLSDLRATERASIMENAPVGTKGRMSNELVEAVLNNELDKCLLMVGGVIYPDLLRSYVDRNVALCRRLKVAGFDVKKAYDFVTCTHYIDPYGVSHAAKVTRGIPSVQHNGLFTGALNFLLGQNRKEGAVAPKYNCLTVFDEVVNIGHALSLNTIDKSAKKSLSSLVFNNISDNVMNNLRMVFSDPDAQPLQVKSVCQKVDAAFIEAIKPSGLANYVKARLKGERMKPGQYGDAHDPHVVTEGRTHDRIEKKWEARKLQQGESGAKIVRKARIALDRKRKDVPASFHAEEPASDHEDNSDDEPADFVMQSIKPKAVGSKRIDLSKNAGPVSVFTLGPAKQQASSTKGKETAKQAIDEEDDDSEEDEEGPFTVVRQADQKAAKPEAREKDVPLKVSASVQSGSVREAIIKYKSNPGVPILPAATYQGIKKEVMHFNLLVLAVKRGEKNAEKNFKEFVEQPTRLVSAIMLVDWINRVANREGVTNAYKGKVVDFSVPNGDNWVSNDKKNLFINTYATSAAMRWLHANNPKEEKSKLHLLNTPF